MKLLTVIPGEKFGGLTVINEAPRRELHSGIRVRYFLVSCFCGKEWEVSLANLTSGQVRSCGCSRNNPGLIPEKKIPSPRTEFWSQKEAYKRWSRMKERCLYKSSTSYKYYGGAGVKICEQWLYFPNFYRDMGECPEGMSIDRYPDPDGNYEPGNCRWATPKEQANNKRRSIRVYLGEEWMTLAEAAKRLGTHIGAVARKGRNGEFPMKRLSDKCPIDPVMVAQRAFATTGMFRGVSPSRGRWKVSVAGRHIGMFSNEVDAALAYNLVAYERYGELAVLNTPRSVL